MVTSGTPSPIRVSQKRLIVVLSVLALLGIIAIGIAWWDSTRNFTMYGTMGRTISLYSSLIVYEDHPIDVAPVGYFRGSLKLLVIEGEPPFPSPFLSAYPTTIPIYLIILGYLATLLLIWLALMNRLARREFMRQRDT
jgi:hypothetical protein